MAGVYTDGTPMRRLRERQGARMRQRGGAALQGEVTQVDHTGADALTSATVAGATSLGTVTTASSARATSRKITALVGAGATVGVTTEPIRDDYDGRVAYDALGGGEDVLVEALVEVHASATVGVLLVASAVGGVGCFRCLTAESGAVAYARLEEDCTTAGNDQLESIAGLRRRWVQLISRGTPSGVDAYVGPNAQTGTDYTLAAADRDRLVTLTNAAAIALEVPLNATVPLPVGFRTRIAQGGAGVVTLTPEGAVVINSLGGLLDTAGQYAVVELEQTAADVWLASRDLA